MAMYESEHTRFMRDWMREHAEEKAVQQSGRALWWDKPQDQEVRRRYAEARVAPRPYAYDTNHR